MRSIEAGIHTAWVRVDAHVQAKALSLEKGGGGWGGGGKDVPKSEGTKISSREYERWGGGVGEPSPARMPAQEDSDIDPHTHTHLDG